jgi:hypothetical protein
MVVHQVQSQILFYSYQIERNISRNILCSSQYQIRKILLLKFVAEECKFLLEDFDKHVVIVVSGNDYLVFRF